MQIGIGITTRNRGQLLDIVLRHFEFFTPDMSCYKFYVYSDNSNEETVEKYKELSIKYPFIQLEIGIERQGIAKAKNKCIKNLVDCDHLFLFDDDCFPKKIGWAEYYINHNADHLMHLDPKVMNLIEVRDRFACYCDCMGVMLYFSKKAIDVLGGYDPRFGIYGYEHAEISRRASLSNLTPGLANEFCTPIDSCSYIYSLDIDRNHKGISPPLIDNKFFPYPGALEDEKHLIPQYINDNGAIYGSRMPGIKADI